MPRESVHPHRKLWSGCVTGTESGYWEGIENDLTLLPESGKFVGYDVTESDTKGELVLIDGANTDGKVYAFAHITGNPNPFQEGIHQRAINPDFLYKEGTELFFVSDLTATFRIKVDHAGDDASAEIATMKVGRKYGLKVVDGVQMIDSTTTDGPVELTDKITEGSRGWVRVKIAK